MAKYPSGRREAVAAWLQANGISPNDVPLDADMTIDDGPDGRSIRCEVFERADDGRIQADETGERPATKFVTVPLQTEPPEWWEPRVKPTRDDLLAVLGSVLELAERWKDTADRKNGPRQELLAALGKPSHPEAP